MSRSTLDPALSLLLSLTGLSPSLAGLPRTVLLGSENQFCSPNPIMLARWFGLFPFRSPLLWKSIRHYLPVFFLFLRLLRCFSSPGSPPCPILFRHGYVRFPYVGFPIQISADLCVFAAPRSFSQLITSFFGSQCQGIRPALLFA